MKSSWKHATTIKVINHLEFLFIPHLHKFSNFILRVIMHMMFLHQLFNLHHYVIMQMIYIDMNDLKASRSNSKCWLSPLKLSVPAFQNCLAILSYGLTDIHTGGSVTWEKKREHSFSETETLSQEMGELLQGWWGKLWGGNSCRLKDVILGRRRHG